VGCLVSLFSRDPRTLRAHSGEQGKHILVMFDRVRSCMASALKLDDAAVAGIIETTTAADLPQWTSVSHLSLVLELEKAFNVQFANDEIVSLGSVAAILERLKAKGL